MATGAKDAVELLGKIGLLDAIKNKLVGAPEEACQKLSVALSEGSVSYDLLYRTLLRLAHLSFANEERADSERFLFELSTGDLGAAIAKARGHCGVIDNIRKKHLQGTLAILDKPSQAFVVPDEVVIAEGSYLIGFAGREAVPSATGDPLSTDKLPIPLLKTRIRATGCHRAGRGQ